MSEEKSVGWVHSVTFVINKDVNGGDVEKKIKELGISVRVLAINKQEIAEQSVPATNK